MYFTSEVIKPGTERLWILLSSGRNPVPVWPGFRYYVVAFTKSPEAFFLTGITFHLLREDYTRAYLCMKADKPDWMLRILLQII